MFSSSLSPTIDGIAADRVFDVLDGAAVQQLRSLGILEKVGRLYLDLADETLGQIRGAIEVGDVELLAQACHKFKSSSANVGAMSLSALCNQIECAAKDGQVEECRLLYPKFLDRHSKVVAAVRMLIAAE